MALWPLCDFVIGFRQMDCAEDVLVTICSYIGEAGYLRQVAALYSVNCIDSSTALLPDRGLHGVERCS